MGGLRFVIALAAAVVAVGMSHARAAHPPRSEQSQQFLPRPEVARTLALGFHALVADWYWMQAVQIVGGETRNPARHAPVLGRLVDVVTTVDPWVDHPYRFAAHWLTDSEERIRFANRLLERGIAHHPDDWRNLFYLGFNHFFYLDEPEPAADAIAAAARLPDAPAYLSRLSARLRAGSSGLEMSEAFLSELARTTEDPQARRLYEKALVEIETERRARILDEARARFRERAGRDLASVEELVRGPHAVLRELPREPHGKPWKLDERSGRIVSSHYGRRYEPVFVGRRGFRTSIEANGERG
jgi:hypothetical protein